MGMNLESRVEKLESRIHAGGDCPLCSAPREPQEPRSGLRVTSERVIDFSCDRCGRPRRVVVCALERA